MKIIESGGVVHLYTDGITDIHIHLGSEPGADTGTPGSVDSYATRPPAGRVSVPPAVAAGLGRLMDYRNGANVKAVFDGALTLGYEPKVAKSPSKTRAGSSYIRWIDPATGAPATFYLNTTNVTFYRPNDRAALLELPGAVESSKGVKFDISTPSGVELALAAASSLKA